MDKRHEEYIEYYNARMKKYENNSMFKNSYISEKALYDAISTAENLDEFKKKLFAGNLHVKNAIAQVKDQEAARYKHFNEIKEFIRAKGPESILAEIDKFDEVMNLTSRCNELNQKNSIEISVDELTDQFYFDFTALENIEVAMRAEVPDEWKKELNGYINEKCIEGKKSWNEEILPNARQWDPGWNLNYNLIFEERHRRKIPIPDESIKKKIELHKKYRGLD